MIPYSEIFYSIQGEGLRSGRPSIFLRLWGCNLECGGFHQANPKDQNTWILPQLYDEVPKRLEDIPVFEYGCDSSYSWSKHFRQLMKKESAETVVAEIKKILPHNTWGDVELVVTGGEPLMNQKAIIELLQYMQRTWDYPAAITFETNGTYAIGKDLNAELKAVPPECPITVSISFKLETVTGETSDKAFKPEIIKSFVDEYMWDILLKPVVIDTEECWQELDHKISKIENITNVPLNIMVMPCGATIDQQRETGYMESIAVKALQRGWGVTIRAHVFIFGNKIST